MVEMTQSAKVERIARLLQKRFPKLTELEVVNLAYDILKAIEG